MNNVIINFLHLKPYALSLFCLFIDIRLSLFNGKSLFLKYIDNLVTNTVVCNL